MEIETKETVEINLFAVPGEHVLIRPYPSHDSFSLATLRVIVTHVSVGMEGLPAAHLLPKTGFTAYRERREGGWGPRTRKQWPGFMLRKEMLPEDVLRQIRLAYHERIKLPHGLPQWDVLNGERV